eukprot:Filipodium_phascolosomae@DN4455_c0_g1_i1.p1
MYMSLKEMTQLNLRLPLRPPGLAGMSKATHEASLSIDKPHLLFRDVVEVLDELGMRIPKDYMRRERMSLLPYSLWRSIPTVANLKWSSGGSSSSRSGGSSADDLEVGVEDDSDTTTSPSSSTTSSTHT